MRIIACEREKGRLAGKEVGRGERENARRAPSTAPGATPPSSFLTHRTALSVIQ